MKKTLLICSGLILFAPLICIGADITHKVGALIQKPLNVRNIQNMSFGMIMKPDSTAVYTDVSVGIDATVINPAESATVVGAHPGIIKISGAGTVAITSTPPSVLTHIHDSTKGIQVRSMKIVYSDGSAISNMNNVEITDNEMILKTIGTIEYISVSTKGGEYKADWPITVDYVGYDGPE